jgi:hypothetical protein
MIYALKAHIKYLTRKGPQSALNLLSAIPRPTTGTPSKIPSKYAKESAIVFPGVASVNNAVFPPCTDNVISRLVPLSGISMR